MTPAEQLRKAQREALHGHWELALLQQMRAEQLPVPEREYRFHSERAWAFDFAWPRPGDVGLLVAVEVEGGTKGVSCGRCKGQGWMFVTGGNCTACRGTGRMAGRHNSAKGYEGDLEKYNQAALMGWSVYRFSSEMIRDGRAIRFLCDNVFRLNRRSSS